MDEITIIGQQQRAFTSHILVGETLSNLPVYLDGRPAAIITDSNVRKHYGDVWWQELPVVEVTPGEASKDLTEVTRIYQKLLELDLGRDCTLVGIGGGVVCDITGFVAATFKRGVDFGFIATTLLAQVDAAMGGKNGVDLAGFKNQVGTIVQPRFVISDINMLRTLPEGEILNGVAEAVKTAAIGDSELFDFLEEQPDRILELEIPALEFVVKRCASVKATVVNSDERESGQRALLNFGHTLGHALESVLGISHGEAVAVGMVLESKFAFNQRLSSQDMAPRLIEALKKFGLPTEMDVEPAKMIEALRKDKKRSVDHIRLPVLDEIAHMRLVDVKINELEHALNDYLC